MDFYVFLNILYIYIHVFYIYYLNDGDAINTVSGAYLFFQEIAVNETRRAHTRN